MKWSCYHFYVWKTLFFFLYQELSPFVASKMSHFLPLVQVYMCGAQVPAGFQLVSKTNTLTVKFHSDAATNKPGFRAVFVGKILIKKSKLLSLKKCFNATSKLDFRSVLYIRILTKKFKLLSLKIVWVPVTNKLACRVQSSTYKYCWILSENHKNCLWYYHQWIQFVWENFIKTK